MNDKSRFGQILDSISEWLNDQTWFQELRGKWDELDPQSRMYLQFVGAGIASFGVAFMLLSFTWSVHSTRSELKNKSELLSMLQSANDESKALREVSSAISLNASSGATAEAWPIYLENTAATSGIPKSSLSISDSKPGSSSDVSKESLYEVSMKKINIRQAVRYAQNLQSGPRPVKLRGLTIDTQPDASGYLDVTLSLSTFALLPKQ